MTDHVEMSFDFHAAGRAERASVKVPAETMDAPKPLVRLGAEGRIASYAAWAVHRGRLWRPAVHGDLSVSLGDFPSMKDAVRSISDLRERNTGCFAFNAGSPMVVDSTVTPGWLFYASGAARLVIPTLRDNDDEPSEVATFVPASVGAERAAEDAESFGGRWDPAEHDVFVAEAIAELEVSGPPPGRPRPARSTALDGLEAAVLAYMLDSTPRAARALHDAVDAHQRIVHARRPPMR